MIGTLGDIPFEVSADFVRTFRDLQLQQGAKYAEHAIHGRKALLEFTGLSPASMSLNIRLDSSLGISPKEELDSLRAILNEHQAVPFILDGEPQGDGLWVIESLNERHELIDNHGAFLALEVSLKLKEYLEVASNGN